MQYKLTTPVSKEDLSPLRAGTPCSSPARCTPPGTPPTSG